MSNRLFRVGLVVMAFFWAMPASSADWPTVHGNAERNGLTADCVRGPYRLDWVAEFPNEIVGTRVEPIVADGKVFIGTLNGTLWALDRRNGQVLWKHVAHGSIQHSPAYADGRVFCGDAGGSVWALDAATGKLVWQMPSGKGGFLTTPLVANRTVYLGSLDGSFFALAQDTGQSRWRFATGGPIRCSAALAGSQVLFASDDMHAY